MFSVGTADARFASPGVESLHRLEVLAIDIGFAEAQIANGAKSSVQVFREEDEVSP